MYEHRPYITLATHMMGVRACGVTQIGRMPHVALPCSVHTCIAKQKSSASWVTLPADDGLRMSDVMRHDAAATHHGA